VLPVYHRVLYNYDNTTQPQNMLLLTTPQHNRKHNCAPCPIAQSDKGYKRNNAKPPRPPYRNTMIDLVVLGCGPIRTGEGAAASFIGVHILGEIWPAGGFDTLVNWDGRTELDRLYWSKKSTIS
jgi:hypothetical protein